jgi:hypothetical protein
MGQRLRRVESRLIVRALVAGPLSAVERKTCWQLAWHVIAAALRSGITVGFVSGDECYGRDPLLRANPRQHRIGYVLAIARNQHITPASARSGSAQPDMSR